MPPKAKGSRPNRKRDEEFIEDNFSQMRYHPDTGQLIWAGRSEDIGSQYTLPPDRLRCVRKTQVLDNDGRQVLDESHGPLMERCHRWAMRNAGLCTQCAGGNAAVQRAVRERIAGAADVIAGELIAMALNHTVEDATRLRALNSLLDRFGIRAGVELSPDVPGWTEVLKAMMDGDADEPDAGAEGS